MQLYSVLFDDADLLNFRLDLSRCFLACYIVCQRRFQYAYIMVFQERLADLTNSRWLASEVPVSEILQCQELLCFVPSLLLCPWNNVQATATQTRCTIIIFYTSTNDRGRRKGICFGTLYRYSKHHSARQYRRQLLLRMIEIWFQSGLRPIARMAGRASKKEF